VILSRRGRILWAIVGSAGLAFIYVPLIVVVINSFNPAKVFSWPPRGFSTVWWDKALHNDGVVAAVWTSVKAGLGATAIALVLGSMVAFAVVRYSWFGRDPVTAQARDNSREGDDGYAALPAEHRGQGS